MMAALAQAAQAMSYLPMPDSALLQQADTVVLGTVAAAAPAPGHELNATLYTLQVEQAYKGTPVAPVIGVLVPGALDPAQVGALTIPGAPHLAVGEQALVFLDQRADGNYVLVHLSLGTFHALPGTSGGQVLVRDLAQADSIDPATFEPLPGTPMLRDLQKFGQWLSQAAAGLPAKADYLSADQPLGPPMVQPRFKVTGPPARWFNFDNGGSVTFYASALGQKGLAGGGYAEFQQAIAAWNYYGRGYINYVYGGTTTATGNITNPDGVNKILFNDPNAFLGGVFDCLNGGIAGYGGWVSSGTQVHNGTTFQMIQQADITIRNGAGCLLSGNNATNATELFGHELGHTLGLLHPCGDADEAACVAGSLLDQAIMRPWVHADGRGAQLDTDDLDGLAFLYYVPPQTSGGSGNGSGGGSGSVGSTHGGAFGPWVCAVLLLIAGLRRRRTIA